MGMRVYTLIVARVFIAGCLLTCALAAQQKPPEPPEEDESLIPKEYVFNPLESARNLTAGNFYFKKGNYRAASKRYLEATRWDPSSAEAFLKLAETDEKLKDLAGAREAYTKYLDVAPEAKNAEAIRKKIARWPAESAKK